MVRIGVFFDGTGNNLYNDEAGKSANGVSNVGKLYRLYQDGQVLEGRQPTECEIHVKAIYIEGVGTYSPTKTQSGKDKYHDDYMTGGGFGALGGQRINQAIKQIGDIFANYSSEEYKRQIDVFGFSRGAAMARDFINTMYERIVEEDYIFAFVGLFDTVASFGNPGDNKNWKPLNTDGDHHEANIDLVLYERGIDPVGLREKWVKKNYEKYNLHLKPKSAKAIVHFIALDEYRDNFPLTDTQGAGFTYNFVGAHSDIGGGYPKESEEKVFDYFPSYQANSGEKQQYLTEPSNDNPPIIGTNWACSDDYSAGRIPRKLGVYCTGKRKISDDLQKTPLVAMHKQALKVGVPLKENIHDMYSDVPDYHTQIEAGWQWSDELQQYYHTATNNITELSSLLNQGRKFSNGANGSLYAERSVFHLKLLAKYAHNSSGTMAMDKERLAPLGFKHRSYENMTDLLKSPVRRVGDDKIPQRAVFHNDTTKGKEK